MQERFYIQLFECNVKQDYVTVLNNSLGQVNERDILRPSCISTPFCQKTMMAISFEMLSLKSICTFGWCWYGYGYRMMLTLRDEQQVDDRFISVQSFICDHFLDPRFLHGQYFTFLSTSVKPSFIFHQYFEDATKIAISNVRLGFHFLNRLKVRKTYSLTAMLTFSFSLYFLLNGQR